MRLFSIVFSVALALTLVYVGCSKNDGGGCKPTTKEEDEAKMQAFMTANGITGTKDPSGMYYQIINPGTGNQPNVNSRVNVGYIGKLTDGTVFDQSANAQFMLYQVVPGWQIGIPKIAKGGSIKLVIPPYLAYGCPAKTGIPSNSVLYFEVNLIEVK